MPKLLSRSEIERFWVDGFLAPIRVMSEAEALAIRHRLEEFEAGAGGPLRGDLRHEPHLQPGEVSLHHVRLVHGSPPNPSDERRIGFAIRYLSTAVRQVEGEDSASLVRGDDRYGHFAPEPRPSADLQPDMLALHKQITERNARILYRGTGVASYNDPRGVGLR